MNDVEKLQGNQHLPNALAKRSLAEFGSERAKAEAFNAIIELWEKRKKEGWDQVKLACTIERDRGWVSRNLSMPANWTLATLGELVQALHAELIIKVIELPTEGKEITSDDAYFGCFPSVAYGGEVLRLIDGHCTYLLNPKQKNKKSITKIPT